MKAYLASSQFEPELREELTRASQYILASPVDGLILADGPPDFPWTSVWAQNTWIDPERIPVASISQAAKELRQRGRSWAFYAPVFYRRASLIKDKLPFTSTKSVDFLAPLPTSPIGAFTLVEENLLLASAKTSHPLPLGEMRFNENRQDPPNRAYLKLWELFTLYQGAPQANEVCLDLGASPGGWTWVLNSLGCRVIAVDKAPLTETLLREANVEFISQSAFALKPSEVDHVDWVFSDIVCYPERLLRLVQTWIDSGKTNHLVCSIKFQGKTDFDILEQFKIIPGSWMKHLYHNKHEVTWVWNSPDLKPNSR